MCFLVCIAHAKPAGDQSLHFGTVSILSAALRCGISRATLPFALAENQTMAAREHQGYQIALVIFVMLTVLLSITTFMFFSKYKEEQQKSAQVAAAQVKADTDRLHTEDEFTAFKMLLGYNRHYTVAGVNTDVEADHGALKPYLSKQAAQPAAPPADDSGEPAADSAVTTISNPLNYREVVKQLIVELQKRDANNTKLTEEKQTPEKQIAANRAEDKGKLDAAAAAQQAAEADRDKERTTFANDRDAFKGKIDGVTAALSKKQEQMTALDTELNGKIAALTGSITKGTKDRDEMRRELLKNRPREFNSTDGSITGIDAKNRTVNINLGAADGLRSQVTFSVYAQDNAKLTAGSSKAKIEVTQITGPHSAVASILEDSLQDLILPGDRIFSPTFHPGAHVHFAIVGITDIDGDGDSDRQRIRDLITINGGVIDVEVTDEGKIVGDAAHKPDAGTRYLIQGYPPSDPKVQDAYSKMIGKCNDFGVQTLSVQVFLDLMGYKADERTVALGRGADPRDFVPKKGPAVVGPSRPSAFRPRRPLTTEARDVRTPVDAATPAAAPAAAEEK
jgi:hypothetical protein